MAHVISTTATVDDLARPWQARCSCGWKSWHYVTEESAWISSEGHKLEAHYVER